MDEVRALASHRFLVRLAFSGALFAWVALFASVAWSTGDVRAGFVTAVIAYAFSYFIVFVCTPLIAPHVGEGVRRLLVLGTLMLSIGCAYAGTVFMVPRTTASFLSASLVFAFVWGLYRALYAIPYRPHTSLSTQSPRILSEVTLALAPLCFGIFVAFFGFTWILGLVAVVALMSLIPLARLRESYESYSWGTGESYGNILVPYNRAFVLHALALGAERTALFLVWPLMVLMLSGSLIVFGLIMTLTLLATLLLKKSMKRLFARIGTHRSPAVATATVVSVWLVRGLAASPAGVLFTQVVSSALPHSRHTVSDEHVYIDEYSALREMASALGVILCCVLVVVLTLNTTFPMVLFWTCLFAGCMAGYAAWYERHSEPRY
jgi:hypothetical protein